MKKQFPKRVLITGNASCANRGDGAILRGLLHELENCYPDIEFICTSRFPNGSSILLDREIQPEILYELNRMKGGLVARMKQKIFRMRRYDYMYFLLKNKRFRNLLPMPKVYDKALNYLDSFDAIIQVGGSFFVDLYGPGQFEWLMLANLTDKPAYLVGHSLGPFERPKINRIASLLFPSVKKIYLRESASIKYLNTLKTQLNNLEIGSDTAWVLPDTSVSRIADAELSEIDKPFIAITVRNIAPFDKRLGVSQSEYEDRIVGMLNRLIKKGFHIIGVSMCTGLDGYIRDDRIVAHQIKQKLDKPNEMSVLMSEYNDLNIGYILQRSKLLIGTRLHSVILSLRYNTPAIAIYYEHKSEGILNKLSLPEWSFFIKEINSKKMNEEIDNVLENQSLAKERVNTAVKQEQTICQKMIQDLFV